MASSVPQSRKRVDFEPLNTNQQEYFQAIQSNDIVFGIGPAGSGKTFVAGIAAMRAMTEGTIRKIVLTRPAVNAGGERLGYLPGTLNEKLHPYLIPLMDVFETYWTQKTILDHIAKGVIEIAPLAFMRGRSFRNAMVLCDEFENATLEQMYLLLTRLGEGSTIVINGDPYQSDIRGNTLDETIKRIGHLDRIKVIQFGAADVVRHPTVQKIVQTWESEQSDHIPEFLKRN